MSPTQFMLCYISNHSRFSTPQLYEWIAYKLELNQKLSCQALNQFETGDEPGWTTVNQWWTRINYDEPWWTMMNHDEPWWTMMNHDEVMQSQADINWAKPKTWICQAIRLSQVTESIKNIKSAHSVGCDTILTTNSDHFY